MPNHKLQNRNKVLTENRDQTIGDRHEYRVVADKLALHWLQFLEIGSRDKQHCLPRAQIWQPSFEILMLECSRVVGWWRLIQYSIFWSVRMAWWFSDVRRSVKRRSRKTSDGSCQWLGNAGRGCAEPSNVSGIMTLDLLHQGKTLVLHRLAVRRKPSPFLVSDGCRVAEC